MSGSVYLELETAHAGTWIRKWEGPMLPPPPWGDAKNLWVELATTLRGCTTQPDDSDDEVVTHGIDCTLLDYYFGKPGEEGLAGDHAVFHLFFAGEDAAEALKNRPGARKYLQAVLTELGWERTDIPKK